jgi:tRNA(Arg) A34 adenosine deaminase TadA
MDTQQHEHFIGMALKQGKRADELGNSPIGSLIVKDGQIVGVGYNSVSSQCDPTAHAEVQAIRDASRRLSTIDLSGCTCYTVMEPCPMCCWALVEAKVDRVVLGARHAGMKKFTPPARTDYGNYAIEELLAMTGRSLEIVTGIRTDECERNRSLWRPRS